jgi:predicted aminopeptidase
VKIRKRIWAIAGLIVIVAVALSPTACYLSRGAWEEGKILARRQPIDELVKSRHTNPEVRAKLSLVLAARQYAADSIRLRVKDSFTTFSQLDRDTLVMVLSAAYRDKLVPYTWWFPIVGRVPYKGFFDFDEARRAAKSLFDEGYDVQVRPSPAFSTLGWFNDPLNSATLKEDTLDLANTVIHEVTHNTFYAPGQAVFNESFANFVGARGAAAFFRSRGSMDAAAKVDASWDDDKLLGDFWTHLARQIDSAYARHPDSKEARIAARDTVYANARKVLVSEIGPALKTIGPFYVERVALNNASLLARRVYAKDLDLFDQVYAREGKNLRHTIARVIVLAKSDKKDPYGAMRRWLGLPPESSPE